MICRSADPLEDFRRQDIEDFEAEEACPTCDNCGRHIPPDEKRYEAHIKGKVYTLCKYCCGEED